MIIYMVESDRRDCGTVDPCPEAVFTSLDQARAWVDGYLVAEGESTEFEAWTETEDDGWKRRKLSHDRSYIAASYWISEWELNPPVRNVIDATARPVEDAPTNLMADYVTPQPAEAERIEPKPRRLSSVFDEGPLGEVRTGYQ